MATVAETAAKVAFSLLAEFPAPDELAYNRRLAALWDRIVCDLFLGIFEYGHYSRGLWNEYDKEVFAQLVNEEPIDADDVEMFLRGWLGKKRFNENLKYAINDGLPRWREGLKPKQAEAS